MANDEALLELLRSLNTRIGTLESLVLSYAQERHDTGLGREREDFGGHSVVGLNCQDPGCVLARRIAEGEQ